MKRRAALASIILAAAPLAMATARTVTLLATCDAIRATGKRRQSWIFNLKVAAVLKGRYEQPIASFELYQGGAHGGERLLALLGAQKSPSMGDVAQFDRNRKIELTIELRSDERVWVRSFRLA